jgi:hypothetical protein
VLHTINIPILGYVSKSCAISVRSSTDNTHVSSMPIFSKCALCSCSARTGQRRLGKARNREKEQVGRIQYSRRSGERDDVVAKSTNPSNGCVSLSEWGLEDVERETPVMLETATPAPLITFKV